MTISFESKSTHTKFIDFFGAQFLFSNLPQRTQQNDIFLIVQFALFALYNISVYDMRNVKIKTGHCICNNGKKVPLQK